MQEKEEKRFEHTYYAPTERERSMIRAIRDGYAPETEKQGNFARLKALNSRVYGPANAAGLSTGVAGTLLFGTGLCMVLRWSQYVAGSLVGGLGILAMLAAYPVFKAVLRSRKRRYGGEILRLSDRLLSGESTERTSPPPRGETSK